MITLTCMPHHDNASLFRACWDDGETYLSHVPDICIDLMPYMIARLLLSHGYDPHRLLVVRLQGADYELARHPLGVLAATPLPNIAAPVKQAAHAVYSKGARA